MIHHIQYDINVIENLVILQMYLTTNGFNHDKSQPDHTSQNISLCLRSQCSQLQVCQNYIY